VRYGACQRSRGLYVGGDRKLQNQANFGSTSEFSGSPRLAPFVLKIRATLRPLVISSCRLLSSSKHLFVCFYFDELPDQSRNSGVEALLLIKVIVKEFAHMNSRDE
jgi:hypothetical protein